MWIIFVLSFIITYIIFKAYGGTCDLNRGACVASCKLQNCATGYCSVSKKTKKKICRCSRCDNGHGLN